MTNNLVAPTLTPWQIADETFVIPWQLEAPPVGYLPMHSLVIRGSEPIIVDTGSPADRAQWLANVASVVDLDEVRWIFLSHDDRDHSGNLLAALDAFPKASLLTTWFMDHSGRPGGHARRHGARVVAGGASPRRRAQPCAATGSVTSSSSVRIVTSSSSEEDERARALRRPSALPCRCDGRHVADSGRAIPGVRS